MKMKRSGFEAAVGPYQRQLPCLAFTTLGESIEVKHTVAPDGQPLTEVFSVLVQWYGPKAEETGLGAALFTKTLKLHVLKCCFTAIFISRSHVKMMHSSVKFSLYAFRLIPDIAFLRDIHLEL